MDLDEAKKAAEETVIERMKKPLTGAFIVAFLLCNWKGILHIFYPAENWTLPARLGYIRETYYECPSGMLFWFPLGFAVLALLTLPFLNQLFVLFIHWVDILTDENKEKINQRYKHKVRAQVLTLQNTVAVQSKEINDLTNSNSHLAQQVVALNETVASLKQGRVSAMGPEAHYFYENVLRTNDLWGRVMLNVKKGRGIRSPMHETFVQMGIFQADSISAPALTEFGQTMMSFYERDGFPNAQ